MIILSAFAFTLWHSVCLEKQGSQVLHSQLDNSQGNNLTLNEIMFVHGSAPGMGT